MSSNYDLHLIRKLCAVLLLLRQASVITEDYMSYAKSISVCVCYINFRSTNTVYFFLIIMRVHWPPLSRQLTLHEY